MSLNEPIIVDSAQIIKLSEEKLQYVNTEFRRVPATMFDPQCDVKLRVGQEVFRAHRSVLTDASDYFAAMFSVAMKEREQDVIEVKEISPTGFTAMMEYFYRGHITLQAETVADMLEAASFFMLKWLLDVGCDFLVRRVSLDNYHLVLELADKYSLGDLTSDIFRFIGRSFTQLSKEHKIKHLSFYLFRRLLSENHFIDAPEGLLLDAVLRWTNASPEERNPQLPQLLMLLRFPLMSEADLDTVPLLADAPEIAERVARARDYIREPSSQCLCTDEDTQVRASRPVVMLLSAVDDLNLLQYKIPGVSEFFSEEISVQFLDAVFEFSSSSMLGNFLFVAGGYDRNSWSSSDSVFRFDPRNRSWAELAPMKQPRVSFCLVSSDHCLYAVGGINHTVEDGVDQEKIISALDRYEPTTGLWISCTPIPIGAFNASAAIMPNGSLWLTGGIFDSDEESVPSKKTQVYNPASDSWSVKPDMLEPRQSHASFQYDGKLIVFGGLTGDLGGFAICRTAEIFDPEVNQWSLLIELPIKLGQVFNTVTRQDNLVYMLAGQPQAPERLLVCYDVSSNTILSLEYCGDNVQRVVSAHVLLPFDKDVFVDIEEENSKSDHLKAVS